MACRNFVPRPLMLVGSGRDLSVKEIELSDLID